MSDAAPLTSIMFQVDERSMKCLRHLQDMMELANEEELQLADIMREGLRLLNMLVQQTREGYSRVILEDPDSGAQREVEIPLLKKLSEF